MKAKFTLLASLFTTVASAGTIHGKVVEVLAHTEGGNGSGVFMFLIDGSKDDNPTCSTVAGGKAWALSLEKESGRAMYSLILTAHAQGKNIFVYGRGHCNSWGDREEPQYVTILQ